LDAPGHITSQTIASAILAACVDAWMAAKIDTWMDKLTD
jgi:hypothetical protein